MSGRCISVATCHFLIILVCFLGWLQTILDAGGYNAIIVNERSIRMCKNDARHIKFSYLRSLKRAYMWF